MKYYCVKWYRDLTLDGSGIPLVESCSQIDIVQKELWSLYRKEKLSSTKKRILDSIVANSLKKRDYFNQYLGISDIIESRAKKLEKEIEMTLAEEHNVKLES